MPSEREAVKVREKVYLKCPAGVLLNIDPQEATEIVSESHTTNGSTLEEREGRGRVLMNGQGMWRERERERERKRERDLPGGISGICRSV